MSSLKYWPYPVLGLLVLLIGSLALAAFAILKYRSGAFQHWPYWLGGALVVIGAGLIVAWAHRPPFVGADPAPTSVESIEEFESYVERLVDSGEPPGVSVAVVKDGSLVYQRGFGYADGPNQMEATADTVHHWWSITKMFTTVGILQLAEKDLLDLNDPVSEHLAFFDVEYPQPDSPPITIRHLLTHTSGLPDLGGSDFISLIHYDGDPPYNQTEFLKDILPNYRQLVAEPGTEGRYTNVGTIVLSAVIEAVTGETYEGYIRDNILRPLGMDHTDFVYTEAMRDLEASGSHPLDLLTIPVSFTLDMERAIKARAGGRLWFNRFYTDYTAPSGLIGSSADLARFMAAMLNEGELDGARILTPESVTAMGQRYIESHRLASRSIEAPVPFEVEVTYEDVGDGTRVTWHQESELRGFFGRLANTVVTRMYAKDMRSNLENLRGLLEAD